MRIKCHHQYCAIFFQKESERGSEVIKMSWNLKVASVRLGASTNSKNEEETTEEDD